MESTNQTYDKIFIIAGGPSVRHLDRNLTKHGFVIGVNNSFFLQKCDMGASMDRLWLEHSIDDVLKQKKTFITRFAAVKHIHFLKKSKLTLLDCFERPEYSNYRGCANGINSGMFALNYALNLRPKTIYLLGFDMKAEGDQNYYYGPYAWVPPHKLIKNRKYKQWREDFASFLKSYTGDTLVKNVQLNNILMSFNNIDFKTFFKELDDANK